MLNSAASSKNDYESLKKFVTCFLEWYYLKDLPPPSESMSEFFERIEKISFSKAKRGLKMAINDIIEIIAHEWTPAQIMEADKRFAAAGMLTLSQVRLRQSKKYSRIVKAGIINNEVEYYIIKGIVDGNFPELKSSEAAKLMAMLNAYEKHIISNS